jgi:hypothetical protein
VSQGHKDKLSAEMARILRACRDGRLKLRIDPTWRWYIEGEEKLPVSCERKLLVGRKLIQNVWDREQQTYHALLTSRGARALEEAAS